jgi:hypothetical protein
MALVLAAGCSSDETTSVTATSSIAGTWASTLLISPSSYPFTLNLTQSGTAVSGSGSFTDENGAHASTVSSGSLVSQAVSLVVTWRDKENNPVTMTITGTLASDKVITGTATIVAVSSPPPNLAVTLTKTN